MVMLKYIEKFSDINFFYLIVTTMDYFLYYKFHLLLLLIYSLMSKETSAISAYSDAIRKTLEATLCLRAFPSEIIEK